MAGLLGDLLDRYPDLDGIELREPIVNWWGAEADYNPAVTRAFRESHPAAPLGGDVWRRFRQATLTQFLRDGIALIQEAGMKAHVTSVADVRSDGTLLPAEAQALETGFDLDALVGGSPRPDAVKVELIWQQWAALYGYVAFTPEWTREAARAFLRQVDGRVPVVVHVELTDFGRHSITPEEFHRTLVAADRPQAAGIDFYSAALADEKGAWPVVTDVHRRGTSEARPAVSRDARVLVLYDRDRRIDDTLREQARLQATELANLLGHFDVSWDLRPVDGYRRGELDAYDTVFYLGTAYGNAPRAFVSDVSVFPGTAVWIGQNLFELAESGVRLPFAQASQELATGFDTVSYHGLELPAKGEVIPTTARRGATVRAWLANVDSRTPFVLESQGLWYVTGSPFSFLTGQDDELNGRYLVFSDLLHEMLGQLHADDRVAFLRIEDVTPLASAARIRELADALAEQGVPFLVAVIPFFVDPVGDETVALSDRPEVAEAIRYAVSRGGAVVLHGSTHQYQGRTALDAEFWDLENGGGVAEDGDDYVRPRIERALEEPWANGIHPLAWETPHYLATPYDYALFAEYFSTFVERRTYGVLSGVAQQQPFPYVVEREAFGGRIVPENLGYLRQIDRDPEAMLANADALRVVRDGVAGGFLHLATPPDVAAGIVDSLDPIVRRSFRRPLPPNVLLCDPLPYAAFVRVLEASDVVLTDSGGVLEEATALGKAILVARALTERPEAVAAGSAAVVGVEREGLERALVSCLEAGPPAPARLPVFGDGHAGERIVDWLRFRFGLRGAPPEPFEEGAKSGPSAAADAPSSSQTERQRPPRTGRSTRSEGASDRRSR